MARLVLTKERSGIWFVWIGHGDDELHAAPGYTPHVGGVILGAGETRQQAIGAAVRDLEQQLELLQAPPGAIEERRS